MFGKRYKLFTLLGFAVSIDPSWFLIAVLVTWSLATGYFPSLHGELATSVLWLMGLAGALGLFLSVVLHELAHSLVARRQGMQMRGITLFIFGGVAEMESEPPTPKAEVLMALAGPAASVAIGAGCFAAAHLGTQLSWPVPLLSVLSYLAFLNMVLAGFNLLPAFPLDGGRVLRSALWRWKQNLHWATRISAKIGAGFGAALMVLGVLHVLTGRFVGGMWWFLIGMFMRSTAQGSYRRLLMRRSLEGEPVWRFMRRDPVTVPAEISVKELVESYVYQYHHKLFPVVNGSRPVACVSTRGIKELPQEQWSQRTVDQIAQPITDNNTIAPEQDAMEALARMHRTGGSRLLVVDGSRLVGVLALKDLLRFFSLKLELEER